MPARELSDLERMKYSRYASRSLTFGILAATMGGGIASSCRAEAPPKAVSAFDTYAAKVEFNLAQRHRSPAGFPADPGPGGKTVDQLRRDVVIEKLTPGKGEVPGGMLHH